MEIALVPASKSTSPVHLNDAARGLSQQMVFWGHDVRHPTGNLLVRHGLQRSPSPGLKGTSCYSMPWEDGLIQLHGATASWTAPAGETGIVFHRDGGRIELWHGLLPPVPGSPRGQSGNIDQRWESFQPFRRWLLAYEQWLQATCSNEWRTDCWRALKRLPKVRPWLPPAQALKWWGLAATSHPPRPKELLKPQRPVRMRSYFPEPINRHGFTLVELLVVLVIVAALGALGLAGMRHALTASRQSSCMGNMKNIGIALHLHATDHYGKFPETTHSVNLEGAWIYALEPYLGDFKDTRVCPGDPNRAERVRAKGTSYLLNSYIFVPEVGPFGEPIGPALNSVSAVPEPERTLIAFICSDRTGTGPGNDHTHSNQWTSWAAVTGDISTGRFGGSPTDSTRGSSNYLYMDGHVESMSSLQVKRKIDAGINIAKPPGIKELQ